jgi:hypothetical protein
MNSRGYRAFSFGIIFAVSVMGSYYYGMDGGHTQNSELSSKKQLEDNGYVILTADEYKKFQEKKVIEKTSDSEETKKVDDVEDNATTEKVPIQPEEEKEVTNFSLEIKSGMNSSEIAELLAKHNIVANKEEFEQFMITNNYQTKIQLGIFVLNNEMSYEEISKILTKS